MNGKNKFAYDMIGIKLIIALGKMHHPESGTGMNYDLKARLVADPGTSGDANGGSFLNHG